ncbi:MAG: hypothetical protein PHY15_05640 [Eubacteriales bacterium]|nr:hypothetical protein [Eubacteriales bacterium]MDD4475130.1 hypothetical protein [Eubacteriales bacterium]
MKKAISFILVLAAITSILSACNPSDTSSVSSSIANGTSNINSSNISESFAETSSDLEASDELSDETSSETSSETSPEESTDSMVSLVNGYLDVILDGVERLDFGSYKNEAGLAVDYPEETAALVALGEEAFLILDDITATTDVLTRRAFAEYIKYIIKPELYDLDYPSPDGKYSIKGSVYTFLYTGWSAKIFNNIRLVDNTTNSVLAVSDIYDNEIGVNWSENNKYVAITHGYVSRYYSTTDVFDIQNSKFIKLPSYKDIGKILNIELMYYNHKSVRFNFSEWLPDDKVKILISIYFSSFSEEPFVDYLTYDLKALKIVDEKAE